MSTRWAIMLVVIVMLAACGGADPPASTSATTTAATTATAAPPTVPTTTEAVTTTTALPTTVPREGEWERVTMTRPVSPQCCSMPAIAPVSPPGQIPRDDWPADGFYDAAATRSDGAAAVLQLVMRRWIPCADFPEGCPPDPPPEGVATDPSTVVIRDLALDDGLTVVIWALDESIVVGRKPVALVGSGTAFAELLDRGIDPAFTRWVLEPRAGGVAVEDIIDGILTKGAADADFPFGPDPATNTICYRGPLGSFLLANPAWLMEQDDPWPPGRNGLYDWWTTLEIRDGAPVLYIHANLVAG